MTACEPIFAAVSALRSVGCCRKCIDLLQNCSLTNRQNLDEFNWTDNTDCVTCFGIIDRVNSSSFKNELLSQIETEDYQFDSFSPSVSCPTALFVRMQSVWNFLCEKYSTLFSGELDESIFCLKEYLKPTIKETVTAKFGKPFDRESPFEIQIEFRNDSQTVSDTKNLPIKRAGANRKKRKRPRWNDPLPAASAVLACVKSLSAEKFKEYCSVPPTKASSPTELRISLSHKPIYLAAKYNKFSREISQTPWIIDGVLKCETSVQEQCCDPLLRHYKAKEHTFHSAGREDMDVRMLGSGRDFLTALVDPHRVPADAEIARMEAEINARTDLVRVSGLRRVDSKYMDHLKEGEENKRKVYRCVVWTSKSISAENLSELDQKNPFVLNQETPIRVMHRRSLMTRPRSIYKMKTDRINEHVFLLDVETQAGTYVKEFVHGDRGRTNPNIGSLLNCKAEILQLDVLDLIHTTK
eukprot:110804_1